MENINWLKLSRLQKSIKRLTHVAQAQLDKCNATPRYAQNLLGEAQRLENLIEENKRYEVDFDFLDPLKKEELVGVIDRAESIINGLLVALQSYKRTENVELLAALNERNSTIYCDQLRLCQQKLAVSLDFLKANYTRRMELCISYQSIPEYMDMFGEDVGLGCLSPSEARTPLIEQTDTTERGIGGKRFLKKPLISCRKSPRARCLNGCECSCHQIPSRAIPPGFSRLFRRLFPKAVNDPVSIPRCTLPQCRHRKSQQRHIYLFIHPAFVKMAVILTARTQGLKLKKSALYICSVVPETSDGIRFAQTGNIKELEIRVQRFPASVNDTTSDGWSLLHNAVKYGHLNVVKYLLSHGARTTGTDIKLRKASHLAWVRTLGMQATPDAKKILDELTRHDDSEDDFKNDYGLSPILVALLKQYDPTDVCKPGVDAVIRFAENIIAPPVDWKETEQNLCKASPIHQQVKSVFQTAEAVSNGILKEMLNKPDALLRWTPLHWAAFVGCKAEMCTLLENHADFVKLTPSRRNILHQAAESGSDKVLTSLLELRVQDRGVDIDLQDIWGETPLHVAVGRSSAAAEALIRYGANVKLQQENGQVPLHYTRYLDKKSRGDCIRTFMKLEDSGLNDKDETGKSAIFYLLNTPDCVDVLLQNKTDTSILDNDGKSVLHHACAEGDLETLELFLNRCANDGWVCEDKQGENPLHECFRHHKPECAKLLLRRTAIRQSKDRNGYNLVHHAVSMGNIDVLNLVLDKYPGINLLAKTNDGETAFNILHRMGTLDREPGIELGKRLSLIPQQVRDLGRNRIS